MHNVTPNQCLSGQNPKQRNNWKKKKITLYALSKFSTIANKRENVRSDSVNTADFLNGVYKPIYMYMISRNFQLYQLKETRSVTMNIFRKKCFLFKKFVKIELSYVFTINMFSTAKNCMEK